MRYKLSYLDSIAEHYACKCDIVHFHRVFHYLVMKGYGERKVRDYTDLAVSYSVKSKFTVILLNVLKESPILAISIFLDSVYSLLVNVLKTVKYIPI